jgi:hypothetical protein
MFTLEEAKKHILTHVLHYDPSEPAQNRPRIIDEATQDYSFGWAFSYNNEAYLSTGDMRLCWVGPGPILFNKATGEIRRHGSGYIASEVAEDYEKELEAGDGCWVIYIQSDDAMKLALRLKKIFGMSGADAIKLAKRIPGPLFKGGWRELVDFSKQISGSTVQVSRSKESGLPELINHGFSRWAIRS